MLFAESDKICEKAGVPAIQRQKRLEAGLKTVMKYDDAVIRLLKVYNETGNWNKAIKIMDSRHFHLWEARWRDSRHLRDVSYLERQITS